MSDRTPSDDDLERRFAELMAHEFPDDHPTPMEPRRPRSGPQLRRPRPEPVTIFERMDAADDEEWERGDNRVRPQPLPPMGRWSIQSRIGAALVVLSLVMTVVIALGVPLPAWANTVSMVAFVAGLATLLFRLVTAEHRPRDDDGARL